MLKFSIHFPEAFLPILFLALPSNLSDAKEKVWNAFTKFNQLLSLTATESNRINRERHRYLCNEADNRQLFFLHAFLLPSSEIFQAIYYITYRLFQDGQDKYVKKQLEIGFTPLQLV